MSKLFLENSFEADEEYYREKKNQAQKLLASNL